MRLPLINLKNYIKENLFDNPVNNKLLIAFKQEYNIRNNFNNINKEYINEKYGSYNGQLKLCKEFADMFMYDFDHSIDDKDFVYKLTKDELQKRYKNLFFKELDIYCNSDCQTGYETKKSEFNNKTLQFDLIVIYININDYHTEEDVTTCLMHEITHAWDDLNRKLNKTDDLLYINSHGYKDVIKKFNSKDFMEQFVANIIYSFSPIEKNAYISELSAVLHNIRDKNKVTSYADAMNHFKKSDCWKRFYTLKDYFENIILKDEKELTKFCIIYNKLNKSDLTEQKIIKQVKYNIDKTFNKILTVIPKIYYDFVSNKDKELNESTKEIRNPISEARYNRLNEIFHSNYSIISLN